MLRRLGLSCILGCSLAGTAGADDLNPETVAACMFAKAKADDIDAMKKLVVAAIEEDTANLKGYMLQVLAKATNLATTHCGVGAGELGSGVFNAAMVRYGNLVGEKVFLDAFAKLK